MSNTLTPHGTPGPAKAAHTPRWVWLLLILLTACLIGGVAGVLAYAGDSNVPGAILTGGGAFAGTVALLLGIAHFTRG